MSDGGAICGGYGVLQRTIRECPTEGVPARMVDAFAPWYGWTNYCTGCGDRWQDGERAERPFARGWRKEWIATAEAMYSHALSGAAAKSAFLRVLRESIE